MNMLKKVSASVLVGVLALGAVSTPARAADASSIAEMVLPSLVAATAEVSRLIQQEVSAQLRRALQAPRPTRVRQSPSVSIIEPSEMVEVVATRLPAIDPIEHSRTIRTAQVRL